MSPQIELSTQFELHCRYLTTFKTFACPANMGLNPDFWGSGRTAPKFFSILSISTVLKLHRVCFKVFCSPAL
jgi:hypothetical protein